MKILGIESSSMVASVAIVDEDVILAEYTVNHKKTHSQTLLPMLDEIVRMTEQDLHEFSAIAVAEGPGSFTGLRIGSATAKGLGLALDLPLVGIPTVDAMAYQLYGCACRICPIMDAKRQQVYTGIYRFEDDFRVLRPACAVGLEELLEDLKREPGKVVFLGDGVPVFRNRIREVLGENAVFAPPHASRQRAAAVAALGMRYFLEGRIQTADEHAPRYLRISQAERERAERKAREMSGPDPRMTGENGAGAENNGTVGTEGSERKGPENSGMAGEDSHGRT